MPSTTVFRSQDLVDAALMGDLDELRAVLARRPRVPVNGRACPSVERAKVQYSIRASALYFAAANHRTDVVALLLANGARPDIRATDGSTPLHIVCANHSKDPDRQAHEWAVVQRLIAAGADVNARWSKEKPEDLPFSIHETPLMVVMRTPGNDRPTQVLQGLIDAGANPRVLNRNGQTMLHQAVIARWPAAIAVLAQAGSPWKRPDHRGVTPMASVVALHRDEQGPLLDALLSLERSELLDALTASGPESHPTDAPYPLPTVGRSRTRL